ncbi:MAG: glycosyltransferase family 39 protein [Methylococcales bacterium]|nr:glycosyltransferase family 39 protein [Methylococcales bacterium]
MNFLLGKFPAVSFLFVGVIVFKFAFLAFSPWILGLLGNHYMAGNFPDHYDSIASNLIAGKGYRINDDTSLTMLRTPGFVFVLAGIFLLFGKNIFAVQIVQFFMSLATGLIVYRIADRLFGERQVSIAACLIFLLYPGVLIAETRAGFECTLMLCFSGCIALSYQILDDPRWRNFLLFGLLFGLTMLVRSSISIYFPAMVAMICYWRPKGLSVGALLLRFFVAGFVSVIVMSPWIVRNYQISGQFVPTMTVGGLVLFQGVELIKNLDSGRDSADVLGEASGKQLVIAHGMNLKTHDAFFPQFYSPADEVKFYNELWRLGVDEYKRSPELIIKAVIHNFWAFWFLGRTQTSVYLNYIVTLPLVIFLVWGSVLAVRSNRYASLLPMALIVYILPHLFFLAVARYHVSVLPLIAILAANPAIRCWQILQNRLRQKYRITVL